MSISIYRKTDIGKIRKVNEDSFVIFSETNQEIFPGQTPNPWIDLTSENLKRGIFCCVIDGMGGMGNGDVASETIANRILFHSKELLETEEKLLPQLALERANSFLRLVISKNPSLSNMGAVATSCYFTGNTAYFAQVGDTRAYLFRHGELKPITEDQSIVANLLKDGKLTLAEAKNHPQRNVVTQALGPRDHIETVNYQITLQKNDQILLCSDGLTTMLSDEDIAETLTEFSGQEAVDMLIERANQEGGEDNITVLLIYY